MNEIIILIISEAGSLQLGVALNSCGRVITQVLDLTAWTPAANKTWADSPDEENSVIYLRAYAFPFWRFIDFDWKASWKE